MLGIDDPYTDADRARKRFLKVSGQGPDGMCVLSGVVAPGLAAVLKMLRADHACPGSLLEGSTDDDRSPTQRFHDALEAALHAGILPQRGFEAGARRDNASHSRPYSGRSCADRSVSETRSRIHASPA
ncbi:DUF222 domain-containing protein [Corynebacterium lactis]|uniref:DUF222 domain-containing protein n=1 Tax=Corynebacterium lactis TaxID=1231000 RepID=UPI001FE019AB|nr:DUF222 domain-containing protein [Corynebacterium lactis]